MELKKKTIEAIGQEITREVEEFLRSCSKIEARPGASIGSDRDGHALGSTPGRCRGVEPTTRIPAPTGERRTRACLAANKPLPRAAQQPC